MDAPVGATYPIPLNGGTFMGGTPAFDARAASTIAATRNPASTTNALANALAHIQFVRASDNTPTASSDLQKLDNAVSPGGSSNNNDVNLDAAFKQGLGPGLLALGQKALDTPVVKQIVDALGVGMYSAANFANNEMDARDEAQNGASPLKVIGDALMAPITGIGQGLSAAVGNTNDQKTFADVIKHGQQEAGVDTENAAAKWGQGLGGFAGDVFLDPITYLPGLGLGKAAVAGIRDGVTAAKGGSKVADALKEVGSIANPGVKGAQAEAAGKDASSVLSNEADLAGSNPIKASVSAFVNSLKNTQAENNLAYQTKLIRKAADKANSDISYDQAVNAVKPADDMINANIAVAPDGTAVRLPDVPAGMSAPEVIPTVDKPVDKADELDHIFDDLGPSVPKDSEAATGAIPARTGLSPEEQGAADANARADADGLLTDVPKDWKPDSSIPAEVKPDLIAGALKDIPAKDLKIAEPKELSHSEDGLYNAATHGAMGTIHNAHEFQEPVYSGNALNEVRSLESASLKEPETTFAPPKSTTTKTAFNLRGFKSDIAKDKVLPQATPAQMDKGVFPKWSELDKEKVKNAKSEKDIETIIKRVHPTTAKKYYVTSKQAGEVEKTPEDIRREKLTSLGIAPEHHNLSSIQLSKLRKPTNVAAKMADHILRDMDAKQIKDVAAKLGLAISDHPTVAERANVAAIFARAEPIYKKVEQKVRAATKKHNIADLIEKTKTDADITEKGQRIAGISVEASKAKRMTDAVEAHIGLRKGIDVNVETGAKGKSIKYNIPGELVESENSAIRNAYVKRQSGLDRPFTTGKTKDKTNTADPKTGGAVNGGRYEMAAEMEKFNQGIYSIQRIEAALKKEFGPKARLTIASKIDYLIRQLDSVEKDLKVHGVQPYAAYINTSRKIVGKAGKKEDFRDKVPLSIVDVLRSMPLSLVRKHLIGNKGTEAIQSMAMHAAMETLYRGMKANHDDARLTADIEKALKGDPSIFTAHVHSGSNDKGSLLNSITGAELADGAKKSHGIKSFIEKLVATGMKPAEATAHYNEMLHDTAAKIVAQKQPIYDNLSNRILANKKLTSIDSGEKAAKIVENVSARIAQIAQHPMGAMEWQEQLNKEYKEALKPFENDPEAYNAASEAIDSLRDNVTPITAQKAANTAKKGAANQAKDIPQPLKDANRNKINREDAGEAAKDAEEAVQRDAVDANYEPNTLELATAAYSTDAMRKIHWWDSLVNPEFGMKNSRAIDKIKGGAHMLAMTQSIFHQIFLKDLHKMGKISDTWRALKDEVRDWEAGDKSLPFVGTTDEINKLYNVVRYIFNADNAKSILNANGISAENFIQMSERKGIRYGDMGVNIDELPEGTSANDLWKIADVFATKAGISDDYKVMDYLSKSFNSLVHVGNQMSIASQLAEKFGKAIPEKGDGYVRINWDPKLRRGGRLASEATKKAQTDIGFYDYLDKSLYYPKEIAEEFPAIHRLLNEVRHVDTSKPMGKFIANVFDPMTNALKATQTTLRPGHWVTNVLGDTIRNMMAGVTDPRVYALNFKVMRAMGHDMKLYGDDPIGAFERRMDIHNNDFGRGTLGGESIRLIFNGKSVAYPVEKLGRLMESRIYLSAHGSGVFEDPFIESTPTINLARHITNMTDFVTNNPKFNINKYAAARDNLTRGAMAIDIARKGNWKDEQEMLDAMTRQLRKWAPTSTDFTAAEAKYARRAILYYTWLRGMTVRVADVATSKPGVALIPNKGLFNMAVAGGVNPISLGNPFPMDQQFPSYYFNNVIGPQIKLDGGELWGFSPFSPFIDVMDTWGAGLTPKGITDGSDLANIGQNLFGQSTPFAKVPVEAFVTGESNGIPIKDKAEYIQDQVSGSLGNLISKMTGHELYPPFQGRTDNNNVSIHGGDQGANAIHQLTNYLSGLKFTQYNSPAAERSVRGEKNALQLQNKNNARRNL